MGGNLAGLSGLGYQSGYPGAMNLRQVQQPGQMTNVVMPGNGSSVSSNNPFLSAGSGLNTFNPNGLSQNALAGLNQNVLGANNGNAPNQDDLKQAAVQMISAMAMMVSAMMQMLQQLMPNLMGGQDGGNRNQQALTGSGSDPVSSGGGSSPQSIAYQKPDSGQSDSSPSGSQSSDAQPVHSGNSPDASTADSKPTTSGSGNTPAESGNDQVDQNAPMSSVADTQAKPNGNNDDAVNWANSMKGQNENQMKGKLNSYHKGEWCADFVNTAFQKNGGSPWGNKPLAADIWNKTKNGPHIQKIPPGGQPQKGDAIVWNGHAGMVTSNPVKQKDGSYNFTSTEGNTDGRPGNRVVGSHNYNTKSLGKDKPFLGFVRRT